MGDPARFAIEYELDENYAGAWLNGWAAVWVGGIRRGGDERWMSLRDFLFEMDRRLCERGRRHSARFEAMPADEVFRHIDGALYSGLDDELETVANDEMWARHELMSGATLGWKVFVIESRERARVIHGLRQLVGELLLEPGECDDVMEAVRRKLQALLEKEGQS